MPAQAWLTHKTFATKLAPRNYFILGRTGGNDSRIVVTHDSIEIIPFYFNYSLVYNFIPVLLSVYIICNTNNAKIIFLGILAFGIFICNTVIQLIFCKKSVVNFKRKNISIQPNFFFKIFEANSIVDFNNIKGINVSPYSFSALYQRFVIKLTLKNSTNVILISTKEKANADKISEALYNIVRSHN